MFSIGKLGLVTGIKVPTIRYYEQVGLLPQAERSSGNQRLYGRPAQERLAFIRHARELGFPIEAIRDLLSLQDRPDQPCAEADAIARVQLAAVEARLARLRSLKGELERMIAHCAHGSVADCRVIETLADHGLCHGDHGEVLPTSPTPSRAGVALDAGVGG